MIESVGDEKGLENRVLGGEINMLTLRIPTIDLSEGSFRYLCSITQLAMSSDDSIVWDFRECRFLWPNAICTIGGLIIHRGKMGIQDTLLVDSMSNDILTYLSVNGFLQQFKLVSRPISKNTIPFSWFPIFEETRLNIYLTEHVFGQKWMKFSELAMQNLVCRTLEIFLNVYEHSDSRIGATCCGQHMPKANLVVFSVVDFGIGIPGRVRESRIKRGTDEKLISWALEDSHSTMNNPFDTVSRGLGLGLIKSLVKENKGELRIISNRAMYSNVKGNEECRLIDPPFWGTIFVLKLVCDNRLYVMSGE